MTRFDFPVINRADYAGVHDAYYHVKKELEPFVFTDTEAYLFAYCHYDNLYNLYYRDHDEFSDPDFDFYIELYTMLMNLFKDMFLVSCASDRFKLGYSNNSYDEHLYYLKGGDLI